MYLPLIITPWGVKSGHKLTVTYYGEITIEPILNPEFDVDHDFEVKNGIPESARSLLPRRLSFSKTRLAVVVNIM